MCPDLREEESHQSNSPSTNEPQSSSNKQGAGKKETPGGGQVSDDEHAPGVGPSVKLWKHLAEPIEREDLSIGVSINWDGPETPVIRARDKVGHLTLSTETGETREITIHPKVQGSVSGMLRAVLQLDWEETLSFEDRQSSKGKRPSAWLTALFARRLEAFLRRIRSRGVEKTEEMSGEIRGRPLVSRYLKENYWTSRERIPCRYVERTEDNLPNRILRHAVSIGRQAIGLYGSDVQSILGQLRRCESRLSSVKQVRIQPEDLRRVRPMLRGAFRAYRPIVRLAELLIRAIDPFGQSGELGSRLPAVQAFENGQSQDGNLQWDLVDMPSLFEEYVREVTGGTESNPDYSIPLENENQSGPLQGLGGKSLELDREPFQVGDGLVVDAKYTSVGHSAAEGPARVQHGHQDESGEIHLREYGTVNPLSQETQPEEEKTGGHVKNSHLYQILAYATHKNVSASRAALVYPSTEKEEEGPPPYYEGLGFRSNAESGGVPVHVFTVRIDQEGIPLEMKGEGLSRQLSEVGSG